MKLSCSETVTSCGEVYLEKGTPGFVVMKCKVVDKQNLSLHPQQNQYSSDEESLQDPENSESFGREKQLGGGDGNINY